MSIATPLGFGVAASLATLAGGLLALRLAGRLPMILGLTAGVVLGVALFDLLPEAIALMPTGGAAAAAVGEGDAHPARGAFGWAALGFAGYMLFERLLSRLGRGGALHHLAPATLTTHSFVDGLGIGLAFQLSPAIGTVVAVAVLTHDLADGVNIVSLCLAAERGHAARRWLLANGAAPLLGVLFGSVVHIAPPLMAPLLGVFAGGFLYIGACELLPRSRALDPGPASAVASVVGLVLIYAVTTLAH